MKPLVVDTNIWIDWIRGENLSLFAEAKTRTQYMPAVVALELTAGTRDRIRARAIRDLIEPFRRSGRLLIPVEADFERAGDVLAELKWPASQKTNDVLIALAARRIGADLWTHDQSDFRPIAQLTGLSLA